MATAIFYGSSTGNTEEVAKKIAKKLGDIKIFNLENTPVEQIKDYDKLILGIATWGSGDLDDSWEEVIDDFSKIDFSGKTIALFGLGDQESYGDTYLDAMGTIYEIVVEKGADVVGNFNIDDDYDYESSTAIINNKFVGLALDEDNQSTLSDGRIKIWIDQIKDKIL